MGLRLGVSEMMEMHKVSILDRHPPPDSCSISILVGILSKNLKLSTDR